VFPNIHGKKHEFILIYQLGEHYSTTRMSINIVVRKRSQSWGGVKEAGADFALPFLKHALFSIYDLNFASH